LKETITKENLLKLIPEEQNFLDRIDQLGRYDLSCGKWNKLYALLRIASAALDKPIFVYESAALWDYDVSNHRQYPHRLGLRSVATMIEGRK
jgi:hypothetical protein